MNAFIQVVSAPVATIRPNPSTSCTTGTVRIFYAHADHLGTPRKVTRPSDNGLMWSWDREPFGNMGTNNNPSMLGAFTYSLRFPGQYALSESGLFYNNYFRDYDPQTGRYLESDPIGLGGGINTYAYVGGNPITGIDPLGLADLNLFPPSQGIYNYANAWNPQGFFFVSGHGNPQTILNNTSPLT